MSEDQFETAKDQWLAVGLDSDYKWCISQMTLACKWEIILGVLEGAHMLIVDSQVRCQINRRTDWKLLNRPLFSDFIEITCTYTTTVFRCFCSFCLGIIRAPAALHCTSTIVSDTTVICDATRKGFVPAEVTFVWEGGKNSPSNFRNTIQRVCLY